MDYHFEKADEAGASQKEIKKAITDSLTVQKYAKESMENYGLDHLGETPSKHALKYPSKSSRITELISIAAAFAVNCTVSLQYHLDLSQNLGITQDEINSVLDSALFIRGEATHYVEQLVQLEKKYDELQQLYDELQRTQSMLVQSEKMAALGKLVATVVHELNTPIGVINSGSDISSRSVDKIIELLDSSPGLKELKENKQFQNPLKVLQTTCPTTTTAIHRISQIINNLKSFARLDEAEFQKVDIHEGLESVLTLLKPEFGERLEIEKAYGDIPDVNCYPAELNQVFMSVLTNAANSFDCTGIIKISTCVEDGNITIQISDDGAGIPFERLKRLFEPEFIEGDIRVKAEFGLFTSYHIMQKHLGNIQVDSEVGKGSTYTITFPQDLSEETIKSQSKRAETIQKSGCDRLTNEEVEAPSSRCDRLNQ